MPRTFLVRRTALQINTPSSTESEEDVEISEPSVTFAGSSVETENQGFTEAATVTEIKEVTSEELTSNKFDHSPTYLSRAVSKAILVDSVTGTIEHKTISVKKEPDDLELDAEVAYHTDKSFTSYTSARPSSVSSEESSDSIAKHNRSYSSFKEESFHDLENSRVTPLSLPLITPHQLLPPFASLAYVFVSSRKAMGETLPETTAIDAPSPRIIKLPLRLPVDSGRTDIELPAEKNTTTRESEKSSSKSTKCNDSERNENTSEGEKEKKNLATETPTTKSAPKIWNPFHHVSTPKTKVLPESNTTKTPVCHRNEALTPQLSHPALNSTPTYIRNTCVPSATMTPQQTRIPETMAPDTPMYSFSNIRHSPYLQETNSCFQTVPQINASQTFHPGFSPRLSSPFLPYSGYCTPDRYIHSHTPSRISTPVLSPIPSTPVMPLIERPVSTGGQKRPSSSTVMETPKRLRMDNLPFQIYKEVPSPNVTSLAHKLPLQGSNTPILTNKRVCNQENIPMSNNRIHQANTQSPSILQNRSPVVLGPASASKENIFHHDSKDAPALNVLKSQPTTQKIEVINGGYGIKNPSFVPPKPADITNIQHDPSGKGSFACKVCGKEFAIQRLLNRHLKCHSDAKRYLCTFCGKGFNDTFDLKRHTRIHTGVKPYKCDHCEKAFTQRCSLESHCRKVHNVEMNFGYKQRRSKTYVCEDCGHSTIDPEVHFNHLKERHPNCPALSKPHDKRHFKFSDAKPSSGGPLRPRN